MKGLVSDTNLTAIADAIRSKTGKTDKIKVASMADEINSINLHPLLLRDQDTGDIKTIRKIVVSSTAPEKGAYDLWVK